MALIATQALLCNANAQCPAPALPRPTTFNSHLYPCKNPGKSWPGISLSIHKTSAPLHSSATLCRASRRKSTSMSSTSEEGENGSVRRVLQLALWTAEAVYILWLFLLPYAPVSFLFSFFLPFLH